MGKGLAGVDTPWLTVCVNLNRLENQKPVTEFEEMVRPPFHLAFPVHDLNAARRFYEEQLGCRVGRTSPTWIDFDFFGHQISVHLHGDALKAVGINPVDGDAVPVRHFGAVLPWEDWEALAEQLRAAGSVFLIAPRVRFRGEIGEQATFFLCDPSGNALEFKSFRDPERLFATSVEYGCSD